METELHLGSLKDLEYVAFPSHMSTGSKSNQPGGNSTKSSSQTLLTPKTPSEPTPELAADVFTVVLAAVPAEDWGRTWAADRTIMLIMTSKRVKELVDTG